MRTFAPDAELDVVYERFQFRPYLLDSLTVSGPDTAQYLLESVPSTATAGDIASMILEQTPGVHSAVRTVIDVDDNQGDTRRLDPDRTLHESGVLDGKSLRVGVEGWAGGSGRGRRQDLPDREQRLRAVAAQIRAFGAGWEGFRITFLDHPEVPTRIVVEFAAAGFVPPGDEGGPLPVYHHRVTIDLPPMFPAMPPTVVWNTPIYHPNIWPAGAPGFRPYTVRVREILHAYEPELDFGRLCALLIDLAEFRYYDATLISDSAAARWRESSQVSSQAGMPPGGSGRHIR